MWGNIVNRMTDDDDPMKKAAWVFLLMVLKVAQNSPTSALGVLSVL